MQGMDCKNFKELLDSYLCGELAVETNHAILRHAEYCSPCRNEMAARRQLRQTLRRACCREEMSSEGMERLRARLRAASGTTITPEPKRSLRDLLARVFSIRLVLPAAGLATVLLLLSAAWIFYMQREIGITKLTSDLMEEAADDHLNCAIKCAVLTAPASFPDSAWNYDPAYVGLDKVAEPGAVEAGRLQLHAAHICGQKGRRFAHLVYTRNTQVVSLLVTERDARALGITELPKDDGAASGLQKARRSGLALGAYQTKKHIVLVVSDMPEAENINLAERLALPVTRHLRQVEADNVADRISHSITNELNRTIAYLNRVDQVAGR